MRVVFLTSSYPRFEGDGAAPFVRAMAEHIAARGWEVEVLAPHHPRVAAYASPARRHFFRYVWPEAWAVMGYAGALRNDQRLHPLAYALIGPYLASGLWALGRLHRQKAFDVLHAHWVVPNGLIGALFARLTGLPLVITLHGSDVYVARRNPLFGRIARWVLSQAGAITASSPELLAGALALGADPARTQGFVYGADPRRFDPALDAGALRARWGVPAEARPVLALGRLVKKKGFDDLVRALPAIVHAEPHAHLIIAGEGPERQPLAALAGQLGMGARVTFAGAVAWDEVPRALCAGEVFVAPSVHDEAGNVDGLPNVILEAMAAGRPVVATRLGGIPWAVVEGETGRLVEERRPEQLAAAVSDLLRDPARRATFGQAARRRVEATLNWDRVADLHIERYQAALRSKPA